MSTIAPIDTATATRVAATTTAAATPAAAAAPGARAADATAFVRAEPSLAGKSTKDMSVRERFATLKDRFQPSKAKGVDVRFQFKLSGKGGGEWYVTIKDGKLTVKEGTGPKPTATLKASASDYKKIADGEMNKMWAFLRGKLKVDGDKDEMKKWDTYFSK